MNPFQIFETWYNQELKQSNLIIPSACCLSTIGLDMYPNARFVSFKELRNEAFIFCGSLHSRKGVELEHDSHAALTFWWTATERQVRIQGDAVQVSNADADRYFSEREREAQIVSSVSKQGETAKDLEVLNKRYLEAEVLFKDKQIMRPKDWGGFALIPLRIEFLEFSSSRFHKRTLFQKDDNGWMTKLLQP